MMWGGGGWAQGYSDGTRKEDREHNRWSKRKRDGKHGSAIETVEQRETQEHGKAEGDKVGRTVRN